MWTSRATKAARTAARASWPLADARGGVGCRDPRPCHAAACRRHRPQGDDDQGCVSDEAYQALLGCDGHRLGVGDGDGGFLGCCVFAVGAREAAGAVAPERALGESSRRPETRLARPPVSTLRRSGLSFETPPAKRTTTTARTAPAPTAASVQRQLHRRAARTASPASSAAKLDCEKVATRPSQRTATSPVEQRQRPPFLGPEQRRHRHHDHQGQVTPVDVRVPEDRVDAEVRVEFVRPDHLVVPEQVPTQVLDGANNDERHRLDGYHPQARASAASGPTHIAQQRVDQRERHEEEAHVLERFREVGRVERLQRVEDDDRGQDQGARRGAGGRPVGARWAGVQVRREAPSTRRPPPLPLAKRQRRALRRRSPGRAARGGWRCHRRRAAGRGRAAQRRSRAGAAIGQRRKTAARIALLQAPRSRARRAASVSSRRSTIWGECHWSPRIRTGKRTSASSIAAERSAARRQQDRRGGEPAASRRPRGEESLNAPSSRVRFAAQLGARRPASRGARCRRMTPPGTRVRSWPSSLTRSL